MIADRVSPCFVTSIVALSQLGPMCHNSDNEVAVRSAGHGDISVNIASFGEGYEYAYMSCL